MAHHRQEERADGGYCLSLSGEHYATRDWVVCERTVSAPAAGEARWSVVQSFSSILQHTSIHRGSHVLQDALVPATRLLGIHGNKAVHCLAQFLCMRVIDWTRPAGIRFLTICSLVISKGMSHTASRSKRHSNAFRFHPAPGSHAGTCVTSSR